MGGRKQNIELRNVGKKTQKERGKITREKRKSEVMTKSQNMKKERVRHKAVMLFLTESAFFVLLLGTVECSRKANTRVEWVAFLVLCKYRIRTSALRFSWDPWPTSRRLLRQYFQLHQGTPFPTDCLLIVRPSDAPDCSLEYCRLHSTNHETSKDKCKGVGDKEKQRRAEKKENEAKENNV